MANRSSDWIKQARRDLEQAEDSLMKQRHEWACFAAHQAAEKAVKALHLHFGQEARGHVVARLIRDLPEPVTISEALLDKARVLDGYYIPTRYPNGHPEGAPFEHYGALQSKEALTYAREIIEFIYAEMARPLRSR